MSAPDFHKELEKAKACESAVSWAKQCRFQGMEETLRCMKVSEWYLWVVKHSGYSPEEILPAKKEIAVLAAAKVEDHPDHAEEKADLLSRMGSPENPDDGELYDRIQSENGKEDPDEDRERRRRKLTQAAYIVLKNVLRASDFLGDEVMDLLRRHFQPHEVADRWKSRFG